MKSRETKIETWKDLFYQKRSFCTTAKSAKKAQWYRAQNWVHFRKSNQQKFVGDLFGTIEKAWSLRVKDSWH